MSRPSRRESGRFRTQFGKRPDWLAHPPDVLHEGLVLDLRASAGQIEQDANLPHQFGVDAQLRWHTAP